MSKEVEEWKSIKGYDGYWISDWGNVKSYKQNSLGKLMKPVQNEDGYLRVNFHSDGHNDSFYIHRLVAQAFIPNHNNYPEVNHKDENKLHNHSTNLEWVTSQYNVNYGTRTVRAVSNTDFESRNKTQGYITRLDNVDWNSNARKHYKGILVKYPDNTYEEFDSTVTASSELGIPATSITSVLKGRYETTHGLKFYYVDGFNRSVKLITKEERSYKVPQDTSGNLSVVLVDKDSNFKVYKNGISAAKAINSTSGAISDVANGKSYSIKGYRVFKYNEFDPDNVQPYDPNFKASKNKKGIVAIFSDNTYKVFNSVNDTAKYLGVKSPSSVSDALKKPEKHVKGAKVVRVENFDLLKEEYEKLSNRD